MFAALLRCGVSNATDRVTILRALVRVDWGVERCSAERGHGASMTDKPTV